MEKAQIWSIDLIIAVMIFTTGIVFFYVYTLNYGQEVENTLASLEYDAGHIADMLHTSGFPKNWSSEDVITLGISDSGQINESKLAELAALTDSDYSRTQTLFTTQYNWYINFSEPMLIGITTRNTIGSTSTNPANNLRVQRITVYRNKPVLMNVYIWE